MESNLYKQPPVFSLAFLTMMCERFGFYVLTFLLVLYAKNAMHYTDAQAFALYAIFNALAYLSTAIGGYLADNFLGIRRCLAFGLLFESIGLILLFLNRQVFSLGLGFVIAGVGLFKTSPTNLLARSYDEHDPRIDSGFTIFYMAINIGSLSAAILSGILQKFIGWNLTFLVGGAGCFLGGIFYFLKRQTAESVDSKVGLKPMKWKTIFYFWILVIAAAVASSILLSHDSIAYFCYSVVTLLIIVYFVYELKTCTSQEKLKITACLSLILMGCVFYVLYHQAYTSIILFINRCIDKTVFGVHIPTSIFFGLNAIWVLVLSPQLARLYNKLNEKKIDFPITTKFSVGLLCVAISFLILAIGSYFPENDNLVSPVWVVFAYLFYTIGELLVAALGIAMITHLAPARMYGTMMGTWFFFGLSLASILSGKFASVASVPDTMTDSMMILSIYRHAFFKIGLISMIFVVLAFIASAYIKRIIDASSSEKE